MYLSLRQLFYSYSDLSIGHFNICEAHIVNYIVYLRLENMTQELGKIVALDGKLDFSKYPIGSTLRILPNHVSKCEGGKGIVHCWSITGT